MPGPVHRNTSENAIRSTPNQKNVEYPRLENEKEISSFSPARLYTEFSVSVAF
jgi:hypothetical protein